MSEATREPDQDNGVPDLWTQFKDTGDAKAREGLILHYSPLVKFVAGRMGVGLPRNVEQADLVSYGIFGLIDAIDKFDLERGFKFETYAVNRIKGAIPPPRIEHPGANIEHPVDSLSDPQLLLFC